MTGPETIASAKQEMRKQMLARRAQLDAKVRAGHARALAAHHTGVVTPGGAVTVAGFAAIRDEINPSPLLEALVRDGHTVGLPVAAAADAPLEFRTWRPGDRLEKGAFGVPTPLPEAAPVTPDIVLAPLLAFDRRGYRLGFGGGYYDRTLAALRAEREIIALGVGFDEQEVEAVPHAPHDQRLDRVLTPSGFIEIAARRGQQGN